MKEKNESEKKDGTLWGFVALLLLMILLWAIFGWWINYYYQGKADSRGTFGDMFGAINALFSGAALAGIIYSIFLQRKELKETREELDRAATAHEEIVKLSAYTAMLNAYSQQANYAHGLNEQRPAEHLVDAFSQNARERDYYVHKIAEMIGETLDLTKGA